MIFSWIKSNKLKLPTELRGHEFTDLISMAAERPVNINKIQNEIEREFRKESFLDDAEFVLNCLNEKVEWRANAANLFVACLRVACEYKISKGLDFGSRMIRKIPDLRAIKSLITYYHRNNNYQEALALLALVEEDEWSKSKRKIMERDLPNYRNVKNQKGTYAINELTKVFLKHIGYQSLEKNYPPAILLYGDIDMNVIDGSSIWLASTAEALSECGFDIHFLLKHNISRSILIENLRKKKDIQFFEPKTFGIYDNCLSPIQSADIIEILDGVYGGYGKIVLRGMKICTLCSGRSSLWNRIWAYLTDFYTIDKKNGLIVDKEIYNILRDSKHVFNRFLVQTKIIAQFMENRIGIPSHQILEFPPMIPDSLLDVSKKNINKKNTIKIGYAGKIAPQWGVLELIDCGKKLTKKGYNIEINIIGDKIHSSTADYPIFRETIENSLENTPLVNWHKGLSRSDTIRIMKTMDLAWCYRDSSLELHTMELSTKLIENIAMNLPFIATKNRINSALLGKDYPLFVNNEMELEELMEKFLSGNIRFDFEGENYRDIVKKHTISEIRLNTLKPNLQKTIIRNNNGKNILVSGHDLKFVGEFESYLKQRGNNVKRDIWEWGSAGDEVRSTYLAEWADIVFCEWGLANAVWYSQNLSKDKRLIVRIHLQEINERAIKFPPRINIENVDATIFVAKHVKQKAVELFEWEDSNMFVISNYVNTNRLDLPKLEEAHKQIGILGVVPMRKRLDRALNLLEGIKKLDSEFKLSVKGRLPKDYPWMLAGRKKELKYYEKQFDRIEKNPDLSKSVNFEGYTNTIAKWYEKVDFVISPSDFESFHYTIADGVASGAFPILWPWEGASDIYPKEWIVKGTDDAVKRIITYCNNNDEEKEKIKNKNKEIIKTNFDMENIFKKLEEITTKKYK